MMSGLETASQDLTLDEYRELAELRHLVRCFEIRSERDSESMGISADEYLLLLAIQGLPEGSGPTVATLAGRLCVPLDKVDALVEDAATRQHLIRSSAEGTGTAWVKLTRTGRETLRRIAVANRDELERAGPDVIGALQTVLKQRRRKTRA